MLAFIRLNTYYHQICCVVPCRVISGGNKLLGAVTLIRNLLILHSIVSQIHRYANGARIISICDYSNSRRREVNPFIRTDYGYILNKSYIQEKCRPTICIVWLPLTLSIILSVILAEEYLGTIIFESLINPDNPAGYLIDNNNVKSVEFRF